MRNKRGSEAAEASIVMPIVILTIILMLRLFAYSLEVLKEQAVSHIGAARAWSSYEKAYFSTYHDRRTVTMSRRGILKSSFTKEIETYAYLLNEDVAIRAGELLHEE